MVVGSIIVITIVVFILVDFALRMILKRTREARLRKEREEALDIGLRLDVSEEAPSLKRVELEHSKARILAVDDEAIVLDSFRKVLVLAGYSIDTVESGAEALGLVRRNDYDFVFTDLKMPGMDGVELTKAVRHLRPDIDVIVITGYGSIETAVETVGLGAMDYIEKPFTEDEILAFVKRAVIKRQARLETSRRHRVRLLKRGTDESDSQFEVNVPAGVFISPHHAWATIEANGMVRVGADDLIRKIVGTFDQVDLPRPGQAIARGDTLFSLKHGEYALEVPSPFSGTVVFVNTEHAERPEWLGVKPFELSWMCGIEPSNLAAELSDLRIGRDSVDWYQEEVERFEELAGRIAEQATTDQQRDKGQEELPADDVNARLLMEFSKPFHHGHGY